MGLWLAKYAVTSFSHVQSSAEASSGWFGFLLRALEISALDSFSAGLLASSPITKALPLSLHWAMSSFTQKTTSIAPSKSPNCSIFCMRTSVVKAKRSDSYNDGFISFSSLSCFSAERWSLRSPKKPRKPQYRTRGIGAPLWGSRCTVATAMYGSSCLETCSRNRLLHGAGEVVVDWLLAMLKALLLSERCCSCWCSLRPQASFTAPNARMDVYRDYYGTKPSLSLSPE